MNVSKGKLNRAFKVFGLIILVKIFDEKFLPIFKFSLNCAVFILGIGILVGPSKGRITLVAKSEIWRLGLEAPKNFPNNLSGVVVTPINLLKPQRPNAAKCDVPISNLTLNKKIEKPILITLIEQGRRGYLLKISPQSIIEDHSYVYGNLNCGLLKLDLSGEFQAIVPSHYHLETLRTNKEEILNQFKEDISLYRSPDISVDGTLTVGQEARDISDDKSYALLNGKVIASARSFPIKTEQISQEYDLLQGDRVAFGSQTGEPNSHIFSRYNPDQGIFEIVAHSSQANYVKINQNGTDEAYHLGAIPSLWTRLQAQSEWALSLGLLAVLLNMYSSLSKLSRMRISEEENLS